MNTSYRWVFIRYKNSVAASKAGRGCFMSRLIVVNKAISVVHHLIASQATMAIFANSFVFVAIEMIFRFV